MPNSNIACDASAILLKRRLKIVLKPSRVNTPTSNTSDSACTMCEAGSVSSLNLFEGQLEVTSARSIPTIAAKVEVPAWISFGVVAPNFRSGNFARQVDQYRPERSHRNKLWLYRTSNVAE